MRFASSAALVLLAGLAGIAEAQSRKSKERELIVQTSAAGQYRAAFPGITGRPDARKVKTDAGEVIVTTESISVSKELTLAVTWTDYPEKFQTVPADRMLAAVVAGMKTQEAKRVGDVKVVQATDPNPEGREVQYEHNKRRVRARLFYVGNRLYQVMATGAKTEVEGPLVDKFLDSFEVVK